MERTAAPRDDWFPVDPAARLAALADCVAAACDRITVALAQVKAMRAAAASATNGGVYHLLLADQVLHGLYMSLPDGDAAAEELQAALMGRSVGEMEELIIAAADGDLVAEAILAAEVDDAPGGQSPASAVYDVADVVSEFAVDVAARCPSLAHFVAQAQWSLDVTGVTVIDGPDRVVVIDLDRCGVTELQLIVATWDVASIAWENRHAVLSVPAVLAAHLAANRVAIDVGANTPVRFDPIPLVDRIADQLQDGVTVAHVYEAAATAGATCPATQQIAARHYHDYGDLA